MKRTGTLASYFTFGLLSQTTLIALIGLPLTLETGYGLLFAATAFTLLRASIEKTDKDLGIEKEMRKIAMRKAPAFRLSFALVGGGILMASNTLAGVPPATAFSYGICAVAITDLIFENTREAWNKHKSLTFQKKPTEVKQYA